MKSQAINTLVQTLEGLTLEDLDTLDQDELGKVESLLHHWQQLASYRVRQRKEK